MKDIAGAMVKQFRQVAAQIGLTTNGWRQPDRLLRDALDVQKTVTMASIVEKETAVPEERPVVASVYYNRLARNIALQADPSVIYAELLERQLRRRAASRRHGISVRVQHLCSSRPSAGPDRESRPHLSGSGHASGEDRLFLFCQ